MSPDSRAREFRTAHLADRHRPAQSDREGAAHGMPQVTAEHPRSSKARAVRASALP